MMICSLCKRQSVPLHVLETQRDGTEEYRLYECSSCLVQFWDPLKNPGAEWYENDIRYHGGDDHPLPANENHKTTLAYLAPRIGRLLDVGCGKGGFLKYAQEKGWDVYGLDFDAKVAGLADALVGCGRVAVADIVSYAAKTDKRFDLITFFDVLEHIDNHDEFMAAVRSLLAPGGFIAMSMPCRGLRRFLNPHDLPPRHLTRWSPEALKRFLERQGFSVAVMHRFPASIGFIIIKLRFRFGAYVSFNIVGKAAKRAAARDATKGGAASALAAPPYSVRLLHVAARLKDWLLFGIPALMMWLWLLPQSGRYTTLFAIARLPGQSELSA